MNCARAGLTCEWVTNDWDSIIPNLVSSNDDTIIAGVSITDERDEVIHFTQNYIPPTASTYVTASDGAHLMAGVISAQAAIILARYIAASAATLVEFAAPDKTIVAVKNGEGDVGFANMGYLVPIVADCGGALAFVGERVPLGGGVGVGIRESDGELYDKFNAVIDSTKADGTLNTQLVKWFGRETVTY